MIYLNFIVEGSTEETFVNDILNPHLSKCNIYTSARRILTGWNKQSKKPAKGGLLKYSWLKNDIKNWIDSDKNRTNTYFTSFVDLYAFPVDDKSPYSSTIRAITDPYQKVIALEEAIAKDIDYPKFIPYIQLHEFETFLMVNPNKLKDIYPDKINAIERIIREIEGLNPEEINETPQNAPSKRIIRHLKCYEGEKAFLGPLVAGDIGLHCLREKCYHFNQWLSRLESLSDKE